MDFDFQKIVQILTYLASKEGGSINYTKAIKILFFSDKLFLMRFWKTISSDSYSALKRWPVASRTLQIIKSPDEYDDKYIWSYFIKEGYNLKSISDPELDFLAEKEVEVIDEIYNFFWKLNYTQLIEKTHQYEEWKVHGEVVKDGGWKPMDIEDFFIKSEWQDSIFDIDDENIEIMKNFYKERLNYV